MTKNHVAAVAAVAATLLLGPGAAVAGTDTKICDARPCVTLVPVHAVGQRCEVRWPFDRLEVPRGPGRRLVWRLVKGNINDPARYVFDRDRGIALTGNSETEDLNAGRHENADRATFGWTSLNRRPREIQFDFVVYRAEPDGSQTPCQAVDPLIVNKGP